MRTFATIEDESFKLKISKENPKDHNFRQHTRSIELKACKRGFAAFQIVLQSDCHTCINLDGSPWFSEFGGSENIYIRHEGKLEPIMNHVGMYLGDDGNLYGDSLKSAPVTDVEAEVPSSVFVRFEIPEDLPAGTYSGVFKICSVHLFEDEVLIDKLKYTLEVLPITLPKPYDHEFNLDLWQHNCNIARKAGLPNWSDRHFEIIKSYLKALSDLGQRAVTAVVTEIPWSGQRCFLDKDTTSNLFEYSMISVYKNPDKTYTYDYSVLDRYIELCFSYGIDREIEVFGLINNWISASDGFCNFTETADAIRIRYRKPDGSYSFMKKAADIEDYIISLCDHFEEKGWLDKVRVIADEPADHETFAKTMEMLRRITPKFRYKAAINSKPFFEEFKDCIGEFCLHITGVSKDYEIWKEILRTDTTHKFTYYVCCYPEYPNTFLSNNLLEARYLALLTDYMGFSGFLRWNFTVWPKDPINDIRCSMWPAGDTNFVYPAGDMTPLLTLRYMALRRGIEDYELVQMLRKKDRKDIVENIYKLLIPNTDFVSFYEDNKSVIDFEHISTTKYSDYQKARDWIYAALN